VKRSTPIDTKALLKRMLGNKPKHGEDFWVFSVVTDDPDTPTWERRIQVIGTYEQNCKAAAHVIHTIMNLGFPTNGLRIESYQGDKARDLLAEGQAQEMAYQRERMGEPHN
jgi:hypothetical protein